jgi:DNA-binding beta-propeller fold protein YncE
VHLRLLFPGRAHACAALALVGLMIATVPAPGSAQDPGYAITKRYQLGGEGDWDYLAFDTAAHRLFIARESHVLVVNPDNGTVIGDIPNTPQVHGIALAYELGRGFITAAGDTAVHIFDLQTLRPLGTIKVGLRDDAIVYDPATKYVVSMNGKAHSASVIDARASRVVATIPLPGSPEFAVTDNRGTVYVNTEDTSLLVEIDLKALKVARSWSVAPCEGPSGLAFDRAHDRLFSGCHNQMMAISDAQAGKVVATVPIGRGVDANRYDPGTGLAFSSNGDGTLTVVHEDSPSKFTVVGNLTTQPGARTMALDPKTHTIYLVTAKFAPTVGRQVPKWPPAPETFVLLVAEKK